MGSLRFSSLWDLLTSVELIVGLLWLGLAAFTTGLLILMHTRWGQRKPLFKCMILSLLAHLLLAGYATTVHIVTVVPPRTESIFHVSLVDGNFGPGDGDGLVRAGRPSGGEDHPLPGGRVLSEGRHPVGARC